MKNYLKIIFSCVLGLTVLTACNVHHVHNKNPHSHKKHKIHKAPRHKIHLGQVSNIETLMVESRTSGEKVMLGATVEGAAENQMGNDRGRDITTDVGGTLASNEIEKNNARDTELYRITVNFDNGRTEQFDYEEIEDLQVGDRVRIENGEIDLM